MGSCQHVFKVQQKHSVSSGDDLVCFLRPDLTKFLLLLLDRVCLDQLGPQERLENQEIR